MKYEKSCGAMVYRMSGGTPRILVEFMRKGHTSLPKGHVEPGETERETALREIREETGLRVRLDTGFRHVIRYSPKENVSKDVVFFVAEAEAGEVAVQESEVLRAEFLPQAEAEAAMTYDSDREVIRAACAYLREQGAGNAVSER